MAVIFNRKSEKEKRRQLRQNMTETEVILWSCLKGKNFRNHKFRRQYGIDRYVVDFYCAKAKLAIEIDGDSHFSSEAEEYDRSREAFIKSLGIRMIRFTNPEIRRNMDGVLQTIDEAITPPSSPIGDDTSPS